MDSSCRNILLAAACISLGLDLVAVLYLAATDMSGFSPAPVSTLCSNYLNAKFASNRHYYSAGFAGAMTCLLCLAGAVTVLGRGRCTGKDYFAACYLLLSGAVVGLTVLSATFLTLTLEQSPCHKGLTLDWVVIDVLAWTAFLPALIAWLINFTLLVRRPDSDSDHSDMVSFGGETPTAFGKMLLGPQQL